MAKEVCRCCGTQTSLSWTREEFGRLVPCDDSFVLCQHCALQSQSLSPMGLDDQANSQDAQRLLRQHFYKCSCGTEYVRDTDHSLPLAYAQHDQTCCPICKNAFPHAHEVASTRPGLDHLVIYSVFLGTFVDQSPRRLAEFVYAHKEIQPFVDWVCLWDGRLAMVSDFHPAWRIAAQRQLAHEFSQSVQIGAPVAKFDEVDHSLLSHRINIRKGSLADLESIARIRVLRAIAMADGMVDETELSQITELARGLGVAESDINEIFKDKKTAVKRSDLPRDDDGKLQLLGDVIRVALADGVLEDSEIRLITRIAASIGVPESRVTQLLDQAQASLNEVDESLCEVKPESALKLVSDLHGDTSRSIINAAQRIQSHFKPAGSTWEPADELGTLLLDLMRPLHPWQKDLGIRLMTDEWLVFMLVIDSLNASRSQDVQTLANNRAVWAEPLILALAEDPSNSPSVISACRQAARQLGALEPA